jgi:two-component system, OmpR family, osmolarity sensor histidine kinase EnvZ
MRLGKLQTLVGKIALLAVSIGAASLVLHIFVVHLLVAPITEDLATALRGRVQLAVEDLRRHPNTQRDARAVELNQQGFNLQRVTAADKVRLLSPLGLPGSMLNTLRTKFGAAYQIDVLDSDMFSHQGGVLRLTFAIDNEPWQATVEFKAPILALVSTAIGWLVLIGGGTALSMWLGARYITRPISAMAEHFVDSKNQFEPLPEKLLVKGEIGVLAHAVNRLILELGREHTTKQSILAGVSHDIRTPLARLRLRVETQCEEPVATELTHDLVAIERIVSQFLAFVQNDMGQSLGTPEDLSLLIQQQASNYKALGHEIDAVIEGVSVKVPDIAFSRILTNLIDNAIAHGQSPLRISLTKISDPHTPHYLLTVWDHGKGLSESEFEKAKAPFIRLSEQAGTTGSCGLGLAIVNQIVQRTGATLTSGYDNVNRFGVSIRWPVDHFLVIPSQHLPSSTLTS